MPNYNKNCDLVRNNETYWSKLFFCSSTPCRTKMTKFLHLWTVIKKRHVKYLHTSAHQSYISCFFIYLLLSCGSDDHRHMSLVDFSSFHDTLLLSLQHTCKNQPACGACGGGGQLYIANIYYSGTCAVLSVNSYML